ncbi:MAG: 50S ribosomal protein L33 [Candidatus Doudnabacteria bacterium]|nr:50S ribosomal protein L33 [bacterium]MDZ4244046.1 50S ribosomal protein L33 [Candidatus Doudnabacteria bacterium]
MPQENLIKLQCTVCKRINYNTTKNKKTTPELLELKKFCKWERKHTLHKEMKK